MITLIFIIAIIFGSSIAVFILGLCMCAKQNTDLNLLS